MIKKSLWKFMVLCVLFAGCASVKEMQKKIANQMPEREGSIPQYQYYVSRNIVLILNQEYSDAKFNTASVSGGIAKTFRQAIQISKSTPGIVPKTVEEPYSITEEGRLRIGVAFEADDNERLWFVQDDPSPTSKFHFDYDDEAGTVVKYGEAYYDVSWNFKGERLITRLKYWWINFVAGIQGAFQGTNVAGAEDESPYLLIKMKSADDIRGAKGRKVE